MGLSTKLLDELLGECGLADQNLLDAAVTHFLSAAPCRSYFTRRSADRALL